jgi:5-methylcytosine-specific restriction endonuclease McrA
MRSAEIRDNKCLDCDRIILRKSQRCYSCSGRINTRNKIPWNKGTRGIQKGSRLGVKLSDETKKKLSERALGRKRSPESIAKSVASLIKRFDRIGRKTYRSRASKEGKIWTQSVFRRDNYTCQYCGQVGGHIQSHHINKFADFPEDRFKLSNGITLCVPCHKLTDNYGKKKLPQD